MYAKIQITGKLKVETGLHIGGNGAFAAIGAVDSPVIRDTTSHLPMIPGSSLKGKIRTLLAKAHNEQIVDPDNDVEEIRRVFGNAKKGNPRPSRILFSDMIMSNSEELRRKEITSMTEVKFENSINRQTAVANPRQIERVIRGAEFNLDLIYEVNAEKETLDGQKETEREILDDLKLLAEGMTLLQYDYLGGSGSRGYGKVKFSDVQAQTVIGTVQDTIISEVNKVLADI